MVVICMRSRTARTLSSCQAGKTGQGKAGRTSNKKDWTNYVLWTKGRR